MICTFYDSKTWGGCVLMKVVYATMLHWLKDKDECVKMHVKQQKILNRWKGSMHYWHATGKSAHLLVSSVW